MDELSCKEAHELLLAGKAVLIDVREQAELVETGTPEGALWMPMSEVAEDTDRWREFREALPKDKPILLFCKSGVRSGRLCEFLGCDGYQTVNLGTFGAWKAAGLPVKPFKS